jgi:hypothetical protein
MFRNLAMAMVSVWAVSTGSPAWSQNSPVEPTAPPSERQFAPSDVKELQGTCRAIQSKTGSDCKGEEARLLFKYLGNKFPDRRTTQFTDKWKRRWLQRDDGENAKIICWTRVEDGDGDPIESRVYECRMM